MQCMIAWGQTHAAVCKHITGSALLIDSILQYTSFFLFSAEHILFSHMGTRILNQVREELLPLAERYLHQSLSSTTAMCYLRVPVPLLSLPVEREATFPLVMRKSVYHWEAKW